MNGTTPLPLPLLLQGLPANPHTRKFTGLQPALILAISLILCACGQSPESQNIVASEGDTPACTPTDATPSGKHWVTSWKTAPGDSLITHPISGLTVRQAFAPHWDGERMRLRLSNRYGNAPVTLENVHIARELTPGSAALVPGSECRLSFAGQSKITIAGGESVVSDAMAYPVRSFERVAISFFAPDFTPQVTRHLLANEALYLSLPGDFAADPSAAAFAEVPDGYVSNFLVIEALEVLAPRQVSTIVAAGDSITDGSGSTTSVPIGASPMRATDQRYPNHLQHRLLDVGLPFSVANAGISGNKLLSGGPPQFGRSLLERLDADVLAVAGASHVLLMIGTNDLGYPQPGSPTSGQDLIDGLAEVIQRVQAAGLKIILGTIPPAEGTVTSGLVGDLPVGVLHGSAAAREGRDAVNAWIREQNLSDGIVDFAQCLEDPEKPGYLAEPYNSGDNLHPSPAGYAAMADCVDLHLFSAAS